MTRKDDRVTRVYRVDPDGAKQPFEAAGIRVPLEGGRWLEVDLKRGEDPPIELVISTRGPGPRPCELDRLAIVPGAANAARVLVGHAPPATDWKFSIVVPDEATPGRLDIDPIESCRFEIEYRDLAVVSVELSASQEAVVDIDVHTQPHVDVRNLGMFTALAMSVELGAANLVKFRFREAVLRRLAQPPSTSS